jgi:hypothetical protein
MPVSNNMPLVSNQIMWISMIEEKIETPMKYFLVK